MLRLLLIAGILTAGFSAAAFSRFAALLLYLWFAFFRPQEWVWIDLTGLRLSLIIAVALVVPSMATGRFPDLKHPLSRAMALLVIAAFFAELGNPVPRSSWEWLQMVAQTALVDLLLVTLVDTPKKLKMVVLVVVASIGFHAAMQGVAMLTGEIDRISNGIGGSFGDNNSYGVVCATIAMLFLALAGAFSRLKLFFLLAAGLTWVALIATFSRGAFLAGVASILTFALVRRPRLRWIPVLLPAAFITVSLIPTPEGYTDRLMTLQSYQEDESASARIHFWSVAVDMAQALPLGVGVQNFNNVYDHFDFLEGRYGRGRSVHNSHLQVLTEAGWVGFAAWLFMLFYALKLGMRIRRRSQHALMENGLLYARFSEGLIAALVAFIVGGAFTAVAWNDLVWCLVAIVAAADRICSAEFARVTAPAAPISEPQAVAA